MLIVRRLVASLPLALATASVVFFLLHLTPGDPVDLMLGEQAVAADKAALRQALGLDLPLWKQYVRYITRLVTGDMGVSLQSQRPVSQLVWERLPATLELALGGMFFATMLAFPLGIVAALGRGGWWDNLAGVFAALGVAMPNFWLGPLLILAFSIHLDWLPVGGRGGLGHLILPAFTLGASLAAVLARMVRIGLVEALQQDYIRQAKAKGQSNLGVVWHHALPNALIPVITVLALQSGALLSGAVITESIFGWPGLGQLLLQGVFNRDYPLVQGCVLLIALVYMGFNMVADMLYQVIDPRIQHSR